MKQLKLISICTFFIIIISLLLTSCNTTNSFNYVNMIDLNENCVMCGFESNNYGISIMNDGTTNTTTDMGKTWTTSNNDSNCSVGLDIINDHIAWNLGTSGNIKKTTDSGMTWNSVTPYGKPAPNECKYLSFINENVGWVGSYNYIGMTINGGNSWIDINLPNDVQSILSIFLLNENEGFLIDTSKKLYITNDCGKTWTSKEIPCDNMNLILKSNNQALRFLDKNNGILFYYSDDLNTLNCLKTSNGGSTWETESVINIPFSNQPLYISRNCKLLTLYDTDNSRIIIIKEQ